MIEKNILSNEFNLHITEKHTGKMEGMASLSTNPYLNKQCMKNRQIEGAICESCFSCTQLKRYKHLYGCLTRNNKILSTSIIPVKHLPIINKMYFRLEAFGDLENETHFINYLNICKKNKKTQFTIWTKNPHIMDTVFNELGYKKPKNLIVIVSSLFKNVPFNLEVLHYNKRYWFIDKIFTVYTKDYIKENDVKINCGSKKCLDCKLCYTKNKIKYINEILK